MTIKKITEELHQELTTILAEHPELSFQNNGYEYIGKATREANAAPIARIEHILREHVVGFSEFFNFKRGSNDQIILRFDYDWGAEDGSRSFTGVGYLPLDHLRDGFPEGSSQA